MYGTQLASHRYEGHLYERNYLPLLFQLPQPNTCNVEGSSRPPLPSSSAHKARNFHHSQQFAPLAAHVAHIPSPSRWQQRNRSSASGEWRFSFPLGRPIAVSQAVSSISPRVITKARQTDWDCVWAQERWCLSHVCACLISVLLIQVFVNNLLHVYCQLSKRIVLYIALHIIQCPISSSCDLQGSCPQPYRHVPPIKWLKQPDARRQRNTKSKPNFQDNDCSSLRSSPTVCWASASEWSRNSSWWGHLDKWDRFRPLKYGNSYRLLHV